MATFFDESSVNRDDDGRFGFKQHSEAEGSLDALIASAAPTAADVRTAGWTKDTLDTIFGPAHAVEATGDETVVTYLEPWGDSLDKRVTIDARGDILQVQTVPSGAGPREDDDEFGRDRWALQTELNRHRLAAAGILTENEAEPSGEMYAPHLVGGRAKDAPRDVKDIAKLVRADIGRAREYGALPDDLDYRVNIDRFSGGQSITVEASGLEDAELTIPDRDFPHDPRFVRRHPHAVSIGDSLDTIVNQWQVDASDGQIDYFSVNYYAHTSVTGLDSYTHEAKALAKARREAKKAGREFGRAEEKAISAEWSARRKAISAEREARFRDPARNPYLR